MPIKYKGQTKAHPWTVKVKRRTKLVVEFEVVQGPGKSRGRIFALSPEQFARHFLAITKG